MMVLYDYNIYNGLKVGLQIPYAYLLFIFFPKKEKRIIFFKF